MMIVKRKSQAVAPGNDSTGFGIARAENEARDTGMDHGSGAHETGFQSGYQDRIAEAVIFLSRTSNTQALDFRMRSGVVEQNRGIMGFGQNGAVLTEENGADRDFVFFRSKPRLFQGQLHDIFPALPAFGEHRGGEHEVSSGYADFKWRMPLASISMPRVASSPRVQPGWLVGWLYASGWGMSPRIRPLGSVSPAMPNGEPFGLYG